MRIPRFTIRSLLGVVLFVAIAVAALRASTDAWDGWLFALTSLILLTTVLLAVHRTDRKRAYWLGFTLFGWTYLVSSLVPSIGSRLPTTRGLAFLESMMPGREVTISAVFGYTNTAGTNPVQSYVVTTQANTIIPDSPVKLRRVWDTWSGNVLAGPSGTTENFVRIGHSLLALMLAFIGGHLSRYLYHIGQRREESVRLPGDSETSR
jgi:hypothetical protein